MKSSGLWFANSMIISCETCGKKIGKFLVPEFVPLPLELLQDPEYVSKIKSPQINL